MTHHIVLGRAGEAAAARYLTDQGFKILDRNWRCEYGEVDLVAREGEVLVFVEVKTRSSTAAGFPLEALSARKVRRMHRVAFAWLDAHPLVGRMEVRVDAISVLLNEENGTSILHLEAVGE